MSSSERLACNPDQPPSQASTNDPAQSNRENSSQDPASFYGSLIDQAGYPSETLCRMTDSLFFYVDYNCPQYGGTQLMEPEKIFWELVEFGYNVKACEFIKRKLLSVYDSFSIPYSLNGSGAPTLDRRGYLHFRIFHILESPEEGYEDWNRFLDVFKLRDPETGIPFPTPIPRSAFPAYPDYRRRSIRISWKTEAIAELKQEMTKANPSGSAPQPSRSTYYPTGGEH